MVEKAKETGRGCGKSGPKRRRLKTTGVNKVGLFFGELFAGIGGFRLGLEQVGMCCGFACEIDKHARKCYTAHFGDADFAKDIRDVGQLPDCDLLCGGWPLCIAGILWVAILIYKWYFEWHPKRRKILRRYRKKECPDCLGSGGVFGEGGVLIDICERCDSYGWVRQIPNHKYKWWMGKMKPEITEEVYDELADQYKI